MPLRVAALLVTLLAALAFVACSRDTEDVCNDLGDCAHGGSTDWVQQCQASTAGLETEAKNAGCGGLFDAYYACAVDKFVCQGNVGTFPGCDRTELDACLTRARNGTSCATLAATCGDGGVGSCSAKEACQARCFLDVVKNACAPTAEELDGVALCAAACP